MSIMHFMGARPSAFHRTNNKRQCVGKRRVHFITVLLVELNHVKSQTSLSVVKTARGIGVGRRGSEEEGRT
jgi:hypothetical protein